MCVCVCIISGRLQAILVPESSECSQWEAEGAESGCPVTAVIPLWRSLTTLDMSHNGIAAIDDSVVRRAPQNNLNAVEKGVLRTSHSLVVSVAETD